MTGLLPLKQISIRTTLVLWAVMAAGCAGRPPAEAQAFETPVAYSQLWGRDGEVWLQAGRLPDFSYAGYRSGERVIPDYAVSARVEDFGAKADDDSDDTAAFQAALAATESGAILVGPGRYIISEVLRVKRSGVVLRGSGAERTTLFFPKPLEAIEPNLGATTGGRATSNYAWSGGFVRFEGKLGSLVLSAITAEARRSERILTVEKPEAFTVGQDVEVFMTDTPENTLALHLYSEDAGDMAEIKGRTRASLVSRIVDIEGNRVMLERRLRFDVRAEWKPVLRAFTPTVQDSGVEDLAFEFPAVPYGGHFTEQGFNPVAFGGVAHCWARRLKFVNADSGPMVGGVFNTVSDVVFESVRAADKSGNQGHHGIYLQSSGDHLFTRFDIRMKFIHDITVSNCAGVVVSQGRGTDLCFDHHKRAPHEILFTDIDLGEGTRPWKSGGGAKLGKHAGARVTFWNLRAVGPLQEPPQSFAPWSINLVGVNLGRPPLVDPKGVWHETMPTEKLMPENLHLAQLKVRLREQKRQDVSK